MTTSCKIILRNFIKKPITNLINILGLSVSVALVIFLSIYCYAEFSTDNFHINGDRVYLYGELNKQIYTPGILKEQIELNIPEVEATVRVAGSYETPVFQIDGRDPITSDLLFADNDFFKLFTYKLIDGNLESALNDPMSVVITRKLAEKLFGAESPIGYILKLNNKHQLTVTAVIEAPASNSILSFSAITSIATRKVVMPNVGEYTEWGWCNFQTFVLVKKGTSSDETAKKINSILPQDLKKDYSGATLTPLKRLYFSKLNIFDNNYLHCGDKKKVIVLLLIAALVLFIALVNFINISLSKWMSKIKQTGVIKVLGASRSIVFRQIVLEAFFLFFTSLILAVLIVVITTPIISRNTGIHINLHLLYSPAFLWISITVVIFLSLIFSLVPAWQISSSKVIDNLRDNMNHISGKSGFRNALVTVQFTIAIALIAFTILVQKQVWFGSSKLGFNQENIIGIKLTPELISQKEVLQNLLSEKTDVKNMAFTEYFPGCPISHWMTQSNISGENRTFDFDTFDTDAEFFKMMGLQLSTGRFYSKDLSSDAHAIVVNETFVREHKLNKPIGTKIIIGMNGVCSEIVGVVKDFHYKSINSPIVPLVIKNDANANYCFVNIHSAHFEQVHKTLQEIKTATSHLSPSFPVEINFIDQSVENLYQSERQFQHLFSLFAICAIVLCCLGILAMSLFTCQRKAKEIGIRKTNGASVIDIIYMLNKDFIKWVVVGYLIACPIAYYSMEKWLQYFAYKTYLSWWIFATAGIIALSVALITVSGQSWYAASRNPVNALRSE